MGITKKIRSHHIVSALAVGGIIFTTVNFSDGQPLFSSTDNFIILAQEKINLASDVTVSSGDIGINKHKGMLEVGPRNILTSFLFASRIVLGPNSIVNGNAFFNKLTEAKDAQILGQEEQTFRSPLVDFPIVADFPIGDQTIRSKPGQEITISPANAKDVHVAPNNKITVEPGTYNADSIVIGNNTTIIFLGTTTINIKKNVNIGNKVVFSPPLGFPLSAIKINSQGNEFRIGNDSITSGAITAPNATLTIGSKTLHRGQLIAKHINIGKDAILSVEENFSQETNLTKIVAVEGEKFPINEIILVLKDDAMFSDVQSIANSVSGRITGFIPELQIYKVEVSAQTAGELENLISIIINQNNPFVIFVTKNIAGGLH